MQPYKPLFPLPEKRTNPKLNPKISAYEALLPYKDRSDVYISFTAIDKIGVNPQSRYETPLGIYTYPLKEFWVEYKVDKTKSPGDSAPFAGSNPYIWVLKSKGEVQDLGDSYTEDRYAKDLKKMQVLALKENPASQAFQTLEAFEEYYFEVNRSRYGYSPENATPGKKFFYISRSTSQGNPLKWNKLFRQLGYPALSDKQGRGIIHPSEPMQAVFFSTQAFEVIDKVLNKDYTSQNFSKELNDDASKIIKKFKVYIESLKKKVPYALDYKVKKSKQRDARLWFSILIEFEFKDQEEAEVVEQDLKRRLEGFGVDFNAHYLTFSQVLYNFFRSKSVSIGIKREQEKNTISTAEKHLIDILVNKPWEK